MQTFGMRTLHLPNQSFGCLLRTATPIFKFEIQFLFLFAKLLVLITVYTVEAYAVTAQKQEKDDYYFWNKIKIIGIHV